MEKVVGPRRCECEGMMAAISRHEMATMSPSWFEPNGRPETLLLGGFLVSRKRCCGSSPRVALEHVKGLPKRPNAPVPSARVELWGITVGRQRTHVTSLL